MKENRVYMLIGLIFIISVVLFGLGSAFSFLTQFFIWTAIIVGTLLLFYFSLMALIFYYGYSSVKLGQDSYTILSESMAIPKNLVEADKEIQSLGFTLLGTIQWSRKRRKPISQWVYRDEAKTSFALLFDSKPNPTTAFVSHYRNGLELEIIYNNSWAATIDEAYLILRTVEGGITVAHNFHQQMAHDVSLKHGSARSFETLEDSITEEETQFWQTKALFMAQFRSAARSSIVGLSFFASGLLGLFVALTSGLLSSPLAIVAEFLCLVLFGRLVNSGLIPENQQHLDAKKKRKVAE